MVRQYNRFTDFLDAEIERLSDDQVAKYHAFTAALERQGSVTISAANADTEEP